jgi:hypothetical protein
MCACHHGMPIIRSVDGDTGIQRGNKILHGKFNVLLKAIKLHITLWRFADSDIVALTVGEP